MNHESYWNSICKTKNKECREKAEQVLEIDPTAIADVEGFWSTIIEEFGSGCK